MRPSRRVAPTSAGFSLIELLVSASVLGLGVVSLVGLHRTAVYGVAKGEEMALATEIATQRAELFATMHPEDIPGCVGAIGCAVAGGGAFADPLPAANNFDCTRWVDGADVPRPNGSVAPQGARFRVDTIAGAHPDTVRHPTARVVTVSVCWLGIDKRVHEVRQRRLAVPEE